MISEKDLVRWVLECRRLYRIMLQAEAAYEALPHCFDRRKKEYKVKDQAHKEYLDAMYSYKDARDALISLVFATYSDRDDEELQAIVMSKDEA